MVGGRRLARCVVHAQRQTAYLPARAGACGESADDELLAALALDLEP